MGTCNPEAGDPCSIEKNIQVTPGQYASKISFNSRTEIEVQIQGAKVQSLKVQVPGNTVIPENGSFAVTSRQSGQPFDLSGVVTTTYQDSEGYQQRESCVVEWWEQECYVTPQGRQCSTVLRTFSFVQRTETNERKTLYLPRAMLVNKEGPCHKASFGTKFSQ